MKVRMFKRAALMAQYGEHKQHKVGCVIAKGNKVLSWGYNRDKTHSKSPHAWAYIHAEFDAIRKLNPEDLVGTTIYIYREKKNGSLALAKPCDSCHSLIKDIGIKEVCYTTEDGFERATV